MRNYELSLAKDYVANWGLKEAIREIFQNALDQEIESNGTNKMFWDYNSVTGELQIGNVDSVLEPKTLLLGVTSKKGDSKTIGQFGEGYKLASLVLTRIGKPLEIFNYKRNEIWRPRFKKSQKYGAEILCMDVEKVSLWDRASRAKGTLVFSIKDITPEEYAALVALNLHLHDDVGEVHTHGGSSILLDRKWAGMLFVNGLYIQTVDTVQYGYDFAPAIVTLDRDRSAVSSFDLKWQASMMWTDAASRGRESVLWEQFMALITAGAGDIAYASSGSAVQRNTRIAEEAYEEFQTVHGTEAYPVTSQEEFERVSPHHKAIFVPEAQKAILVYSTAYEAASEEIVEEVKLTLYDKVASWIGRWGTEVSDDALNALNVIMEEEEEKNG